VPFLMAGTGIAAGGTTYDEIAAATAAATDPAATIEPGWTLMQTFLNR